VKRAAVMALYGKVSVDEFDRERSVLPTVDPEEYRTLREDYEFVDAKTGEVTAVYDCYGTTCDLRGTLRASERFWSPEDG
jgi:hypothetical protein